MSSQIEILAALQTLDREIKRQNTAKQEILGEVDGKQKEMDAIKREIDALKSVFAEKEKFRQEKDRSLQDEGKKAVDRRMRMNRIKNIKELQALQREIDQIKQSNAEVEDQLIKVMEEIDGVKSSIAAKEEDLAKVQSEWQQKQNEMREQVSRIDQEVAEQAQERQRIASQVGRDLISRYELIFSRRGGTAVVEVAGGICQGCYMNIPPQLWNEIIKSEKVNLCPSCQRILYHKPALAEENSA
ncbi:MAG TPA: C4-type zinc ribbon domain-containing protein [Candidatus Binatia bacterium]